MTAVSLSSAAEAGDQTFLRGIDTVWSRPFYPQLLSIDRVSR